jgi:riboflavin transporter FmnP
MKLSVSKIVQIALLSALAVVFYYIPKFPLPFFPGMLKVQFSMLPTILGGFLLGPVAGIIIVVIKFLFKVLSTQSAAIGEIMDLIIGISVVLVTSLIYNTKRNKKSALFALGVGIITWVVVGVVLNGVMALPVYSKLYGINAILGMMKMIPGVTEENYVMKYLLFGCLPFNLMLSIVVSVVTFFVYDKLGYLFNKMDSKNK